MTLSITTFSITRLSIKGSFTTLSIGDSQHNSINSVIMLIVTFFIVMLSVIMLNKVILSVVMLSVVAPYSGLLFVRAFFTFSSK